MRDLFSHDVETAAYLAQMDPETPYLDDDRPTRAEAEEDAYLDWLQERRREEAGR